MFTYTRKPLGNWFVAAFLLFASVFSSLLFTSTAFAALNGTWIDKSTIRIGTNPDFKGPSNATITDGLGRTQTVQAFSNAMGKVYFAAGANIDTARTATLDFASLGTPDQVVNLSNTRSAVPAATTPPPTTPPGGTTDTTTEPEPVCDVGALSFAFCPVIDVMKTAVGIVGDIIDGLMILKPLPLGDPNSPIFKAWSGMLNLANVLLAIAFLFVIFAQATSLALSNYGVKRMLPRIIAAAILMNLSYYICAFAIDVSNLAGSGINQLLLSVNTLTFGAGEAGAITANAGDGIGSMLGALVENVVKGTFVLGAIVLLVAFALVPTLLAVLAVLFTLAARHAIIVLLVMVAPLAFVAWVLPNTEKWFKKWWEWFFQMLILYPLVMAAFAAAVVAANLVATGVQTPDSEEFDGVASGAFQGIIALIILALPLFILPALFKVAGGTLGRLNNLASTNIGKYGGNAAHSAVGDFRKRQLQNTGARLANNDWAEQGGVRGKLGRAGVLAGGYKARRDFKHSSQKSNADYIQNKGVASEVINNDRFAQRAAGVGGTEGMNRARGSAAATLMKAQGESIDNEIRVLEYQALQNGTSLKNYSADITRTALREATRPASSRTYSPSVVEAAFEAQAREGNMSAFEEARGVVEDTTGLSREQQFQSSIDRVISRNIGTFKGKGGFHLQADFKLRRDNFPAGPAGDAAWADRMTRERIGSLSNADAMNLNGLKHGWFDALSREIASNPTRIASVSDPQDLQKAYDNVYEALTNDTARASIGDRLPQVQAIEAALRAQGLAPTPKP